MAEKEEHKIREEEYESLVRIYGYDIPGTRKLYPGLTRIKGISWTISNALCLKTRLDKHKKISDLSKDEIAKIESFIKIMEVPKFMKNRPSDTETGESSHLLGNDLDLAKQFDIKRLKKIKSYKGIRHTFRLPVRGQRTRGHFRAKGKAVGVKRKK